MSVNKDTDGTETTTFIAWTSHDGLSDPAVQPSMKIEVRFRDGETAVGRVFDWDQNWHWATTENGYRSDGAIVGWRPLSI